MSIGTPSSSVAANKAASDAANASRAVLLWGAALAAAVAAALGAWWAASDAAPATVAPAAVQAPVSVGEVARHPRERCEGRHLIALHRCLMRECEKPEFQAHRDCQRVREIEARARDALGG
jgi:hypothetical protein